MNRAKQPPKPPVGQIRQRKKAPTYSVFEIPRAPGTSLVDQPEPRPQENGSTPESRQTTSKNKIGLEGHIRDPINGSKKKMIKPVNIDQIQTSKENFGTAQYQSMTDLATQQQYDPAPLQEIIPQTQQLGGTSPWLFGIASRQSNQTQREPESSNSKMSMNKQ